MINNQPWAGQVYLSPKLKPGPTVSWWIQPAVQADRAAFQQAAITALPAMRVAPDKVGPKEPW